jgi:hypothetical protein
MYFNTLNARSVLAAYVKHVTTLWTTLTMMTIEITAMTKMRQPVRFGADMMV